MFVCQFFHSLYFNNDLPKAKVIGFIGLFELLVLVIEPESWFLGKGNTPFSKLNA